MKIKNQYLLEDLNEIIHSPCINWDSLKNTTFLITGATGLICSILVKALLLRNENFGSNINIIIVVRSIENAKKLFADCDNSRLTYYQSSVENIDYIRESVDYIIHAAAPTTSTYFVQKPVETINTIILGMNAILEIAREKKVKSCLFLSSMEVYGTLDNEYTTEEILGFLNLSSLRSSYPEAKRVAELLAYSYYKEFGVPIKNVRLAQTIGPGVLYNDKRVFKQFLELLLKEEDIIIKSTGKTIINFCYTIDCVLGMLKVLSEGKDGETYNIVADSEKINLIEIAEWMAKTYSTNSNVVCTEKNNGEFAPDNIFILSNEKLKGLGWEPHYGLKDSIDRLHKYLKDNCYE